MSYQYLFKFIIVGDQAVGKSCICYQFLKNQFKEIHFLTIGLEFGAKILQLGNKEVKLQIWDTAGSEKYKAMTRQYYRAATGAIVVYDITSRESFQNVTKWIEECQQQGKQDMIIILIGNKVDLEIQYNIHNINGDKFPYKKDRNLRMKRGYILLKQVQRIIQTLLKLSHRQPQKL
ncbi:unnamed protein product [Paramecium sonneborni]|uniref:Uncharacterized protein n=1 Tax=Paramecium sonneborni TaxID=65129 RepID=A0A8S1NUF4_9CILI|nr:unnamed protein product [Paramecium sonneborni]